MVFKRELEKQIAELIRENAVLKGRTEEFEKQILGLLYKYESVYKRFPDLKDAMDEAERVLKENAELKSELTKKADTNHSLVEQMAKLESDFRICEKNADAYYDQLTKAIEILKEFCTYRMYDCDATRKDYETFEELKEQAEQFLKEIEK